MKPWQYRVRRGWKLFHIFYQNWTLNMVGVCKEWRRIRGCFENIDFKNPAGVGWPLGQSLIFHRTKCEQMLMQQQFSVPQPMCSMPSGGAWEGRLILETPHEMLLWPARLCSSFTQTVVHGGMEALGLMGWVLESLQPPMPLTNSTMGKMPAKHCASVSHLEMRTAMHFCCVG